MMLPAVFGAGNGFAVTADMFSGLTSGITANAEVLIPVGVGIMAIMIGISVIPRIIYKFL